MAPAVPPPKEPAPLESPPPPAKPPPPAAVTERGSEAPSPAVSIASSASRSSASVRPSGSRGSRGKKLPWPPEDDYKPEENETVEPVTGPVDRYGWSIKGDTALSKKELELRKKEDEKEREREGKWALMLGKDDAASKARPFKAFLRSHHLQYEGRVIKGIPDACRSRAWYVILDPDAETQPKRPSIAHYYRKGIPGCDGVIRVDIPRTMPHMQMFSQQNVRAVLYRVLRAYSNADKELGYFQGMAFPAALLVAYMSEERAFWAFYYLMRGSKHRLRDYYINEFENLKELNRVWDVIVQKKYPKIHANLKRLDIDAIVYTTSWFLTAFLNIEFPAVLRLRIFDRYCAFGSRALLSLGLTCVSLLKKELMAPEMEKVLPILQNPNKGQRLQDWRAVLKKWDKLFISKADYSKYFERAGVEEFR
jgi:hypothetical protein